MNAPWIELSATAMLWIKALHVISVIAWMAGLLYLPRLFVYHVATVPGGEQSETFKIMERRLMRGIMSPARIAVLIFGALMLAGEPALLHEGWLHAKLLFVLVLYGLHDMMNAWRKAFEADRKPQIGQILPHRERSADRPDDPDRDPGDCAAVLRPSA